MMSHLMIPPKILTKMPFTPLSERIILNALETFSLEAPPPTSRKLAGSPPYILIISKLAIAKPAPLTIQPIFPSNFIYARSYFDASLSYSSSSFSSLNSSISGWRYKALSSKLTLASRHNSLSVSVIIKGLTSTRLASFSKKNLYIFFIRSESWPSRSFLSSKALLIVFISFSVTPIEGSI